MPTPERLTTPEIITPIKTLLIANRGEIAVRMAEVCERRGIRAIVPYSSLDSERNSYATRMADKNAVKGWELAPLPGVTQEDSYANPRVMLQTAQTFGADAIFLGYGFLAENAEFVRMCEESNPPIRVLAPSSDAMEKLGNKVKAREIAKHVKIGKLVTIPVLEGSPLVTTYRELAKAAGQITFPVMVKDPDLGGGMGNLVARNKEELQNAYKQLRIGKNKGLFLERFVENAVHVEIQIAGDNYGNVVALGERDCTMQRLHQKVIEESPSPHITNKMRNDMRIAAVNLAKEVGYAGVGTVEFVVDRDRKDSHGNYEVSFMEVNTRIQVEHPVTEEQTRIITTDGEKKLDILNLMIDIAEGRRLPFTQKQIKEKTGYTIEARVYAEDTYNEYQPQEGILNEFTMPNIPGVRVDKGYEQGDRVSTDYDVTLCKITTHTNTREETITKLIRALEQLEIAGITTNREFLIDALKEPFQNKQATTRSLEQWWTDRQKEKFDPITEFLSTGSFTRHEPSRIIDRNSPPLNLKIKTANSEKTKSYVEEYLPEQQKKTGQESAAEYGIFKRDGVQFVLYFLNYEFNAGAIGKAEANTFEDACKLAHEKMLPLATISSSAGMRQWENDHALQMMSGIAGALSEHQPLFLVDIAVGSNFGGWLVAEEGNADIRYAVDQKKDEKRKKEETKIGFAGPYAVALVEGKHPESTDAKDAYAVLDTGTHTPQRHFQKRTIDRVFTNQQEASNSVTHICHLLKGKYPSIATDPHIVYRPEEKAGYKATASHAARYDAPDVYHPSWIPARVSKFWDRFRHHGEVIFQDYKNTLPVLERRRLVKHPDRPSSIDIMYRDGGVFDDSEFLTFPQRLDSILEQTPPTIEAFALLDGQPIFVMGQTRQRKQEPDGSIKVDYDPQRPADARHTKGKLNLAKKLKLPVLQLGDTEGGACDTKAEDENQPGEIGGILTEAHGYPYPIISINIGKKGSGEGATYIWYADAAAAWDNATFWVSDLPTMHNILTKIALIDEEKATPRERAELEALANQLTDATAEGQFKAGYIDHIIKEGKGGAHIDPRIVASGTKQWLQEILPDLLAMEPDELKNHREQRRIRIMQTGTVKNPKVSTT